MQNEIGSLPHTIHKVDSRGIKDLNRRPATVQLLEENTGEKAS